jgi:hypothetical protein
VVSSEFPGEYGQIPKLEYMPKPAPPRIIEPSILNSIWFINNNKQYMGDAGIYAERLLGLPSYNLRLQAAYAIDYAYFGLKK